MRVFGVPGYIVDLSCRERCTVDHNYWQGEKVRLRAVETRDVEAFTAWELDSEAWRSFDVIHFPPSHERMHAKVELLAQNEGEDDSYYWVIEDRDGQTVGMICTYSCNRRHGTFRFGILISREYRGHGYARDAITMVLRYYFRELGYQKVVVGVYAFNEGSLKLHEQLGFQQEGRLRRMISTDGEYHDEYLLGLLREDFREHP